MGLDYQMWTDLLQAEITYLHEDRAIEAAKVVGLIEIRLNLCAMIDQQAKIAESLLGGINDIFCAIDSQKGNSMNQENVLQDSGVLDEEKKEAVIVEPAEPRTEREKAQTDQHDKDMVFVTAKIIGLSQRIDKQAENILGLQNQIDQLKQRINELKIKIEAQQGT